MRFVERSFSPYAKVDHEAGVISGVKILGRESKNGRTYTDAALADAARLYEGLGVNIDHPERSVPDKERGFAEGFGELRGVAIRADGVYGDLHYLTKHPLAEMVAEKAQRMPAQFGLSHNAEGYGTKRNGKLVVEGLESARSVDIVLNPATTSGLFESEDLAVKITLREVVEKAPKRNKVAMWLKEQMDAGALAPEMPVETAPEDDAAEAVKKAFRTAILNVLDDDQLSVDEQKDKIGKLLEKREEVADSMASDMGDEAAAAPAVEESHRKAANAQLAQLQEQVNNLTAANKRMHAEAAARDLLEQHGIETKPVRINALVNASSDAERKELLEDWPKRTGPARPAYSAPLYPRDEGVDSYPATTEDFLKRVRV